MSQVFISYSRRDEEDVRLLVQKLEGAGHKVWLDRSAIQGGAKWQEEIVRGIGRADVFVIILSQRSIESENVEKELGLAYVLNKAILPVMLHRIVIPPRLEYALAQLETIDMSVQDAADGSQRLLNAIRSPGRRMGRVYLPRLTRDKLPKFLYFLFLIAIGLLDQHTAARLVVAAASVAGLGVWWLTRRLIYHRWRTRGVMLSTELKGFIQTRSQGLYRIASEWIDPETRRHYRFFSKKIHSDTLEFVKSTIPVMVDRRNPKRYRVDLSFLPKMPSGSLVACSSPPRGECDRPAGIFISHAGPDGETVHRLAQELQAAGFTVWTEGREAGDPSYEEQVIHAIDEAPLFLLTLSPDSVVSHRVRTELDVALSKAKRVITVVLRRTNTPEEMDYALVGAQHVDLSQDFELGLLRLLDTIERKTPEQTVAHETLLTACADALGRWYRASQSLVLAFLGQFILAPAFVLHYAAKALPERFRPPLLNRIARVALLVDRLMTPGNELKVRGTLLWTEHKHTTADDEGRERLLTQWRDPVSGQLYLFRSVWLPPGSQQYIKTKTIAVYVDPRNLRKFSVDLSMLPESSRRQTSKSALRVEGIFLTANSFARTPGSSDPGPAPLPSAGDNGANECVFLSYSQVDADRAVHLISQLERAGHPMVGPSTPDGSETGSEEVKTRIGAANAFVIVVPPPDAGDLRLKNLELRHACAVNCRILPITIRDSEIPLSMQLSLAGVQRIDLSRDSEAGMQILLSALSRGDPGRISVPDSVNELPRATSIGRLRRILFSAMRGALCWALGSTLAVVLLDPNPRMHGDALAIALSGLVCGAAVGAIFYKPRIHMGKLLPIGFLFGGISFFLTLGIAFLVASPAVRSAAGADTDSAGGVGSLTLLLAAFLGAATLVAGKRTETGVRRYRVKKKGKLLLTEYKGLQYDKTEEHNGNHYVQVVSEWRDPVTDELHIFLSEKFLRDPSYLIRSTSIAVYVDPANFDNYSMDLSISAEVEFVDESGEQTKPGLRSLLWESVGTVVLGVILFVLAFPILLFNESHVVRMARALEEGAKAVVDAPADRVNPTNERKLVHVTGRATTDGSIADPIFGVSANAIKLRRRVLMYQWQETSSKETDSSGNEIAATYHYDPIWSDQPIDSGAFHERRELHNPPMPFRSVEYVATDVKLGAFKLNRGMVSQLTEAEPVDVSGAKIPESVRARASRLESGFAIGNQASPRIGDMRITFQQVASPQVSIVARQAGDTFEPYQSGSGGSVELVVMGIENAATMFANSRSENSFGPRTWWLRCLGFGMMFAGLALVLRPFSDLEEGAPVIGNLMHFGLAVVCSVTGLCLSLVMVAFAWISFRPFLGISLLSGAGILASLGYWANRPCK